MNEIGKKLFGKRCIYKNCKSYFYSESKSRFYRMPKDETRYNQWLQLCGRLDLTNKPNFSLQMARLQYYVCDKIFESHMYNNPVKKVDLHNAAPKPFQEFEEAIRQISLIIRSRPNKTFSLAGFGAGITEGILVNPFEVVKVTLQSNRAVGKEIPSTWVVTKDIVAKHGFGSQGLFKGVSATIWRNGVFNMVYFGFYHSVKGWLPEYKDPLQEFFRKVAIGFVSGTLASCINIPFDVAKSRIQGPQPVPGEIKYRGTFTSLSIVYKEEGYLALYKGLIPKVMRLGPGGAIMLVVYDYVHNYLTDRFR